MNKVMIMIATVLIGFSSFAQNELVQSVYNAADAAPSIRIKYNGTSTATLSNTVNVITLTDGGTANTITCLPAGTFATLIGEIGAATNSDGEANFQAELVNAIGTDVVSNKVLAVTAYQNLANGKWQDTLYFDTSSCLFYSVASYGDIGQRVLKNLFGDIKGTGDVTVKVYVDGTEKYSKVMQSPVFTAESGTVFNTNANVSAEIDLGLGIVAGGDAKVAIRATRATTATTGGIGASFEARK